MVTEIISYIGIYLSIYPSIYVYKLAYFVVHKSRD